MRFWALSLFLMAFLAGCGKKDPIVRDLKVTDLSYAGSGCVKAKNSKVNIKVSRLNDLSVDGFELYYDPLVVSDSPSSDSASDKRKFCEVSFNVDTGGKAEFRLYEVSTIGKLQLAPESTLEYSHEHYFGVLNKQKKQEKLSVLEKEAIDSEYTLKKRTANDQWSGCKKNKLTVKTTLKITANQKGTENTFDVSEPAGRQKFTVKWRLCK